MKTALFHTFSVFCLLSFSAVSYGVNTNELYDSSTKLAHCPYLCKDGISGYVVAYGPTFEAAVANTTPIKEYSCQSHGGVVNVAFGPCWP